MFMLLFIDCADVQFEFLVGEEVSVAQVSDEVSNVPVSVPGNF